MNPLDFLNQNPALTSLIAFPLGLVLLLATAKYAGLGRVYADLIATLKAHTAAEIKIEERLSDVVSELKNVVAAQWDNRRYIDEIRDYFTERFNQVDHTLQTVFQALPKRKAD